MNTTLLAQELEPLNAQIEDVRASIASLETDLRRAEAELETFSEERARFDALQGVCDALGTLSELGAEELFWGELPEGRDVAGHLARLRERVGRFEETTRESREKADAVRAAIDSRRDELDVLFDEVAEAYARDERRKEEFVIEREVSPVPHRVIVMPWSTDDEGERYFRRSVLVAMLLSIVFGALVPLVHLPVPDIADVVVEIPERLATLVRKEPPKPEPVAAVEPKPEEPKPEEAKKEKTKEKPEPKPEQLAKTESRKASARKKAESTGVLAFRNSFSDLLEETPVAKLGAQARLRKDAPQAAGQARPQRSLVAMQATGSSGGIGQAAISRDVGVGGGGGAGDRIDGVGFSRVESSVAGLAGEERPVSAGPGPARTDEEIQIVFDRYKATLYRIYNRELRRDPTLRGKMLLRITIEPGGEVSLCKVESTDLDAPELVAQIADRVSRFNFGAKEGVPKTTILYPIDFLPAG